MGQRPDTTNVIHNENMSIYVMCIDVLQAGLQINGVPLSLGQ